MYALTISDLELALEACERSEQHLVDLQVDRHLLRSILVAARQHENGEKLLSSAMRLSAAQSDFDTTPLQVDSLPKNSPENPGSGPNSPHHHRLSQLIEESARK